MAPTPVTASARPAAKRPARPADPALPLHAQLRDSLLARIAEGEFGSNGRLPSQRDLCAEYGMSHMTVRRAIDELIHAGLILSVPGKGLYVADQKRDAEAGPLIGFSEDMARRGLVASSRVLAQELLAAPPPIAHRMGLEPGAPLVYLRRLRLADGQPMAIQTGYIQEALCPGLLQFDLQGQSLFAILREHYGLRLSHTANAAEAGLAGADEAALLQLSLPAALLITEQLTYTPTGQVVEFVRSIYRADRYRLRYIPVV